MEFKNSKPEYSKPVSGTGIVKVGEGRFSIEVTSYAGNDKKGNPEYDTQLFKFKNSQLPEWLEEVKNGKTYYISVKPDGKGSGEILQMRPAGGIYTVVFSGFARERDDENAILIIEGDGKFGKYWQIVAELEVVSGEYKGIKYPIYLPLAGEDPNNGEPQFKFYWDDGIFTVLVGKKSGNPVRLFKDLIHFTGVDEYKFKIENGADYEIEEVLELVEKVAKKLKQKFMMVAEAGRPKSFTDAEDVTEETTESDEEPKTTKKSKVVEDADPDEDEPKKPVKKSKVVDEEPEEDTPPQKPAKRRPVFEDEL